MTFSPQLIVPQFLRPSIDELFGVVPSRPGDEIPVHYWLGEDGSQRTTASTVFVAVGAGGLMFDVWLTQVPAPPPGFELIFRHLANIRNDLNPEIAGVPGIAEARWFDFTAGLPVSNSTVTRNRPSTLGPSGNPSDTVRGPIMRLTDPVPINTVDEFALHMRTSNPANTARSISDEIVAFWRKL